MPREPKRRALLHPKDIASLSDEHAMHYHNTLVIVEKLDLLLKQSNESVDNAVERDTSPSLEATPTIDLPISSLGPKSLKSSTSEAQAARLERSALDLKTAVLVDSGREELKVAFRDYIIAGGDVRRQRSTTNFLNEEVNMFDDHLRASEIDIVRPRFWQKWDNATEDVREWLYIRLGKDLAQSDAELVKKSDKQHKNKERQRLRDGVFNRERARSPLADISRRERPKKAAGGARQLPGKENSRPSGRKRKMIEIDDADEDSHDEYDEMEDGSD